MAWTTSQSEANASLNAQEFANRKIQIPGTGAPSFNAPQDATYVDQSQFPSVVYRQLGPGTTNNWQIEGVGSGSSTNGAVFITDIAPTGAGNVGGKNFSSDGNVLDSCVADTDFITVHVLALPGHSNLKPVITIDGNPVTLVQDADTYVCTGSLDIDRSGATTITADHEDGASFSTDITDDVGPEITSAKFTGGYPGSQSELKEDDTFDMNVVTDADMVEIEVDAFGAAKAETIPVTPGTTATITVTIADQGNTPSAHPARIRAKNANGSYGAWFDSGSAGSNDGEHVVNLNNLHPSVVINQVNYPPGQSAIKGSEQGEIEHELDDYDSVIYSSPTGELSIINPTEFDPLKELPRIGGTYNVDTPNLEITATRNANDAVTVHQEIIKIADEVPQITITEPATRLRSGGNQGTSAQNHEITLQSNQELYEAPTITAQSGTLQASMVDSGNGTTFTQDLRVHDTDSRGVFSFGLTSAKNLAGHVVVTFTAESNYEIGGFVSRTITVPAFEHELDLGVDVSDTAKLVALDKDLAVLTYANDLSDVIKEYTITSPSDTLNPNGNLFHWKDSQAVNNNTTGLATITIEETV